MLALIFDERPNVWIQVGDMVSTNPNVRHNVVNMSPTISSTINIDTIQSLYESNYKNFYGYSYSLSFSKELASDIVQTVFARLVVKIKK